MSVLDHYALSDQETVAGVTYSGYLDPEGNWYICRKDVAGMSYRYVKGAPGWYAEAWGKRAAVPPESLPYDYFDRVFRGER